MRPFSMFDTVDQGAIPPGFGTLRKNQSSEDILRDAQVRRPPGGVCGVGRGQRAAEVQGLEDWVRQLSAAGRGTRAFVSRLCVV